MPLGDSGGPAKASDGWILFDSDADNLIRRIFAVRADGTGLTQLTSGSDSEAVASPDGATLVFTSDRAGSPQIFSMNMTTRNVRQLTTLPAGAGQAAFSPDGKTIAFNSSSGIYLMNTDGTSVHQVIYSDGSVGNNYEHPVFTPNGAGLLVDRENEIDAFDLSGTMQRYVVENWTESELCPAVSRDGVNVAYVTRCP
jgi:TolB protein